MFDVLDIEQPNEPKEEKDLTEETCEYNKSSPHRGRSWSRRDWRWKRGWSLSSREHINSASPTSQCSLHRSSSASTSTSDTKSFRQSSSNSPRWSSTSNPTVRHLWLTEVPPAHENRSLPYTFSENDPPIPWWLSSLTGSRSRDGKSRRGGGWVWWLWRRCWRDGMWEEMSLIYPQ